MSTNTDNPNLLYQQNIDRLAAAFPEVIIELAGENGEVQRSVDFDALAGLLSVKTSDNVVLEDCKETYGFSWIGKNDSLKEYESVTGKKLVHYPSKSINTGNTQNIYIEGDNLDALKLLRSEYAGRIKMIYIDPPYNTGSEFVYKDRLCKSAWCSMMYPRLLAARDLLCDKGMIFISIDEHELSSLLSIVEEIYGAKSFDVLIWRKNGKQGNTKKITRFKTTHEYIIAVYMDKKATKLSKIKLFPNWKASKGNQDNDPRGCWESGVISRAEHKSNVNSPNYYSITLPSGRVMTREFYVDKDTFERYRSEDKIFFPKGGDGVPRLKIFENEEQEYYFDTIIDGMGTFTDARDEIAALFSDKNIFDTPKPVKMIKEIVRAVTDKESIVMDFFGGSSTTAHAVMQLNAEDGGCRKFIIVQIPEKTDPESDAFKAGYKDICEIGRDRIIRSAGKLMSADSAGKHYLPDTGFRVFRVSDSE